MDIVDLEHNETLKVVYRNTQLIQEVLQLLTEIKTLLNDVLEIESAAGDDDSDYEPSDDDMDTFIK